MLQHSLRLVAREPGFAALAIATLALGIGSVTSIFGVVESVMLRPLPYGDPSGLYMVWETDTNDFEGNVSGANLLDWRAESEVFDGLAAFTPVIMTHSTPDRTERLAGVEVTSNFFEVLGVRASDGRTFSDTPGDARTVVLSYEYWQRGFGSNRSVLGDSIVLNEESYEIIGVAPAGFEISFESADIWTRAPDRVPRPPVDFGVAPEALRGLHWLRVFGRLRTGVSLGDAQAEMDVIATRLAAAFPDDNARRGVRIVPLHEQIVGDLRRPLSVLFGAVGLVLLIVCANVAGLCLARGLRREKDVAVRAALGASRWRLLGEHLLEAGSLALAGGSLGVLLSLGLTRLIILLAPGNVFRLESASVNLVVLGFALGTSLLSGLFFGALPAFQGARLDLRDTLGSTGRHSRGGRSLGLRSALVVTEVALAMVLLVSAGLLVRSFLLLQNVGPGFSSERVLTLRVWLPDTRYDENAKITAAYREILERLSSVPGVEAASAVLGVPLSGTSANFGVVIEGRPAPEPGEELEAGLQPIAPGYFRTMGIPLLSGRDVSIDDDDGTPSVALVSAAAAERFFPGENPLGKRMSTDGEDWIEVIGVVGDVLHRGLDREPRLEVYAPFQQVVFPFMTVVLRTRGEPSLLARVAQREVHAVAPDVPVYRVQPMSEVVAQSIATPRFQTFLLGSFAVTAVALAAIGLYGLLAYNVGLRRREIGIRMAVGASVTDVARIVVSEGVRLAAFGLLVGLAASFAVARLLDSFLFEVGTTDPATYLVVSVLLLAISLLATLIPARRASSVQPVAALKQN